MGAYLSEPEVQKHSTDESGGSVRCGASCMQGWRLNQEDAHNTILDFDENTMLFAVFDGHGGAEVADYCSQKLPDYIKNTEAYKNGDLCKALEDAFLGFDAEIATKEVMEILKEIAGKLNPPAKDNGDSSEDEENMSNLYQDAQLPLRDVLAMYAGEGNKAAAAMRAKLSDEVPLSPCLRGKKDEGEVGASSSSGAGCSTDAAGGSGDAAEVPASSEGGEGASSSSVGVKGDGDVSSSTSGEANEKKKEQNGEVSTSDEDKHTVVSVTKDPAAIPDSSEDNRDLPASSESGPVQCNGDVSEGKAVEENSISSSQNGDKEKGKKLEKNKVTSSEEKPGKRRALSRRETINLFRMMMDSACDDEDSDSNDETFEGAPNNSSSDEEQVNGERDSSEDGEEESEEASECEEEEEESDDEYTHEGGDEPGNDSGCTAVVALLRGNELYVANAGDSRCIVCREGVAVDMSIDHKPEDAPELERITKAGGEVSQDGRVNGGLNLSRAIGDHSYKQNKELDAKSQMITALPDVKTLTIDPEKDEYMVIACDGIWNFMSSQDVCDFISPRLKEGREKLSQICEEMFDHCLAPSTAGDGTGCDNMTAIIVTFNNKASNTEITSVAQASKRASEPEQTSDSKRYKADDSCSVVTSSV